MSWGEALRATSYEVTLWPAAQPKPATPTAVVPLESYSPAVPLANGTHYRWQVTAVNDFGNNTEAAIWEFTTESLINTPVPANGSANMLAWMPLQWAPAPGATAYDVFLWRNGETKPALPTGTVTTLINHGINGGGVLTIRDGDPGQTSHFGGTAPQPFATTIANEHPDVVVLFIGINDIWWRETSEAVFEQALRDIVAQAKAGGVSYFVMATPWLRYERPDGDNISDPEIAAFSARCRKVVADTGATLVDLHTLAMAYLQNHNFTVAANGTLTYLDDGFLTYDGVHPSNTGNDFLADQLSLGIFNAMAGQAAMRVSLDLEAWPQATIRTQANAGRVHVLEYSDNLSSWSAIETRIPLTAEVIFTITNPGTTELTLGEITKDGADEADFAVGAPGTSTLTAGGSTTFTVTFSPSIDGVENAAIHIANDAPGDVNPFDIALTGSGHLPGATIVVTEPFDYPEGLHSGPFSTTLGNASGLGWGGNAWFSHAGTGWFDVSMWVNPTAATAAELPAPDLQILGASPFSGNRQIGSLNWKPGTTQIDNFKLAFDYADFGIGSGGSAYDTWAAAHAGGQAPDLDFDNDGVRNGVEFFMGSPDGFTANPGLVAGKVTWPHVGEVDSFEVQVSDNLIDWLPANPDDVDTTTDPTQVVYTLPTAEPKQFCRLVVTP